MYFGEDVDFYENGQVDNNQGAWRAGVGGATAGVLMPGTVSPGLKSSQENAPGVAQDQGEVVSVGGTQQVPAGTFNEVLRVTESSPLDPGIEEFKVHAPGVGLIKDAELELVSVTGG